MLTAAHRRIGGSTRHSNSRDRPIVATKVRRIVLIFSTRTVRTGIDSRPSAPLCRISGGRTSKSPSVVHRALSSYPMCRQRVSRFKLFCYGTQRSLEQQTDSVHNTDETCVVSLHQRRRVRPRRTTKSVDLSKFQHFSDSCPQSRIRLDNLDA